MSNHRVPAGVPTGGQFAPACHAETDVTIDATDPVIDPATEDEIGLAFEQAWSDGVTDHGGLLDRVSRHLSTHGVHVDRDTVETHTRFGRLLDDEWDDTEPDVTGEDDLFANPGERTWKGAGFRPSEAAEWMAVGVTSPSVAQALLKARCTVADARTLWDTGMVGDLPKTVGAAVDSGELTVDDAVTYLDRAGRVPTAGF